MTKKDLGKPPYCNTGAENTCEEGLKPCVDWVQATFKNVQPDELIDDILLLKSHEFADMGRGTYGYTECKRLGDIQVFYGGREDMGVHLQISGNGCREYEAENLMTWDVLFDLFLRCDASFTRLDVAIDDYEGYFKIPSIVRKIKDRQLQSKFKKAIEINDIEIASGKVGGKSIYFGSAHSRIRIRMYDKQAEQGTDYFWNRTEVQARDERAQVIAYEISKGGEVGKITSGILRNYLRFVVKGKDSNRSRWKTAGFWDKFLGDVEPMRLTMRKPDKTLQQKISWLDRQVSKTLSMLVLAYDGDLTKVREMVRAGQRKLNENDLHLIEKYKESQSFWRTFGSA